MTDRNDAQLESLLREHFAAKLDRQVGRAAERFLRDVPAQGPPMRLSDAADRTGPADPHPPRHRSGWSVFAWSIGLAGGAVAAGLAIVMVLAPIVAQRGARLHSNGQPPHIVDSNRQDNARGNGNSMSFPPGAWQPQDVEHALSWRTIDQGTVYLGGDVPLRSVVRQANETVRWYDPQRRAHVEMTVPRDEVMLVGYESQ